MRLVLIALALIPWAVPIAAQQTAPLEPTTFNPSPGVKLVPSPPPNQKVQADRDVTVAWMKAMREKHEGKFPGPPPRLANGRPDLSGTWIPIGRPEKLEMTPLALAELDRRYRTNNKDFPYSVCLPPFPTPTDWGFTWEVLHSPERLVTLHEDPPYYRLVFLDGRPHPPDADPTWTGHSIGRWDGDALAVESVGFNDRTYLEAFLPHTDKLRIRERWTRPTMGTMVVERTYDDPDVFVTPYTIVFTLFLAPGEVFLENICENNKFPELSHGQNP
ncbi:MAG: hypothetical protein ACRD3C_10785 [Vicinamibacterales bacterium]